MSEQLRRWCWSVVARMHLPLPANAYHDAALRAAYERDHALALALFEIAARDYARTYELDRLAHLRIQQLFVKNAAAGFLVVLTDCAGFTERIARLRGVATGQVVRAVLPGEAQLRPAEVRELSQAA